MDDNEIKMSILRYLYKNPQAEDTLEAIALWWIMRDRYELRTMQVKNIARQLVAEGFLVEKKGERYAVNPERLTEISTLVADQIKSVGSNIKVKSSINENTDVDKDTIRRK